MFGLGVLFSMFLLTFPKILAVGSKEDLKKTRFSFLPIKQAFPIWAMLFIFFAPTAFAQSADSSKSKKLHLLPIAYYTPETRLGLGCLAYKVFKTKNQDSLSRSSNAQTYCSVTLNKQFLLENEWTLFLKNERYFLSGNLDYTRFPEFFFGIGNHTLKSDKKRYSFDLVKLHSKNLKMVAKNLFLGFQYDLQYLFDIDRMETNMMENPKVAGANGYVTSGLGTVLRFDSRDNVLNSTKGTLFELQTTYYGPLTLGQFRYNSLTAEIRKFQRIGPKLTIAIHGYAQINDGTVPFRAMPALGGAKFLRGFYRGRFRDQHMVMLQTELRAPLFWRIGMVAFGGMGQVAHQLSEFDTEHLKYSYGTGLRYKINKKDKANLRIDLGFTNESHGLYVVFAEAF
jgi:outer membrane protein assembly factor BamA